MAAFCEPLSVLSLAEVIGLRGLDVATLRRWFHEIAEGTSNYENDPAKQVTADATVAEIDRVLASAVRGPARAPRRHDGLRHAARGDGRPRRTHARVHAHAEARADRRAAGTGPRAGDHGGGAARRIPRSSRRCARIPAGRSARPSTRGSAGSRRSARRGAAPGRTRSSTALRSPRAPRSGSWCPRRTATRRCGGRRPTRTTSSGPAMRTPRSGSVRTSASGTNWHACRCGRGCGGCWSGSRDCGAPGTAPAFSGWEYRGPAELWVALGRVSLAGHSDRARRSRRGRGMPSRAPATVTERVAAMTARATAASSGRPSASPAASTPLRQSPAPVVSTASTARRGDLALARRPRGSGRPPAPRDSTTTIAGRQRVDARRARRARPRSA